jgi:hypothetical protein
MLCRNFESSMVLSVISIVLIALVQIGSAYINVNSFSFNTPAMTNLLLSMPIPMLSNFVTQYMVFFLQILVIFCLTKALLPAFKGLKISIQDYIPTFQQVFYFVIGMMIMFVVLVSISIMSTAVVVSETVLGDEMLDRVILFMLSVSIFIYLCRYLLFYVGILQDKSVLESLKSSSKMLKGSIFKFILILILLALLNYVGMLLIVGLVVTLPFSVFVFVNVYIQLSEQKESNQNIVLRIEDDISESTEKELI